MTTHSVNLNHISYAKILANQNSGHLQIELDLNKIYISKWCNLKWNMQHFQENSPNIWQTLSQFWFISCSHRLTLTKDSALVTSYTTMTHVFLCNTWEWESFKEFSFKWTRIPLSNQQWMRNSPLTLKAQAVFCLQTHACAHKELFERPGATKPLCHWPSLLQSLITDQNLTNMHTHTNEMLTKQHTFPC